MHTVNATFAGTDFYEANNYQSVDFTVYSYQLMWGVIIFGILVFLMLLSALIRGGRAVYTAYRPRKYIKLRHY